MNAHSNSHTFTHKTEKKKNKTQSIGKWKSREQFSNDEILYYFVYLLIMVAIVAVVYVFLFLNEESKCN